MIRAALASSVVASRLIPSRARLIALRLLGFRVPLRGAIAAGVVFRTTRFQLGRKSTLNFRCLIDNGAAVEIGANVGIGDDVRFITGSHEVGGHEARCGPSVYRPIVVGDGVWVGSGATILGGVTIEPGCIIAAGSVVTKNCQRDGLYAGVPARRMRELS